MAKRHGKRVRSVCGRTTLQSQERGDHPRHLQLLCGAKTADGQLDGARRIFEGRRARAHGGTDGGAAGLAELERAVGIAVHEDAFDRDLVRPVFGNQGRHRLEDASQAQQEIATASLDAAVGNVAFTRSATFDHAVSGTERAWIEPQDAAFDCQHRPRRLGAGVGASTSAGGVRPEAAPGAAGIPRHATTCRVRPLLE
jgi:hypothetical protein